MGDTVIVDGIRGVSGVSSLPTRMHVVTNGEDVQEIVHRLKGEYLSYPESPSRIHSSLAVPVIITIFYESSASMTPDNFSLYEDDLVAENNYRIVISGGSR